MSAPFVPELKPVKSSNIESTAHHQGDLYVKFQSGAVWRYSGVPKHVFDEMHKVSSIGNYFAVAIKGNYPGIQIDGPISAAKAKAAGSKHR